MAGGTINPDVDRLPRGVFSTLEERVRSSGVAYYPLHEGDTYRQPPCGCHLSDLSEVRYPGMHRYSSPRGRRGLLEAVVASREERDDAAVSIDQILVTPGVTGGLSALIRTLLAPGQALMALAPFWPLIRGMTTAHGVEFLEVPFNDRCHAPTEAMMALSSALRPNARALYVNWPNNPTGEVPSSGVVDAVCEFARANDLWLISDETYEHFVFEGVCRFGAFAAPGLADRVVRAFSFSKTFGFGGNRLGYLVGPPNVIDRVLQLSIHSTYCAGTAAQIAAELALRQGADWLEQAREEYWATAVKAAALLGVPPPRGATFLFVDVSDSLDGLGLPDFLEDVAAEGLLVAPGSSCGRDYGQYVRVCFTTMEPELALRGVEILARRMAKAPGLWRSRPEPKRVIEPQRTFRRWSS